MSNRSKRRIIPAIVPSESWPGEMGPFNLNQCLVAFLAIFGHHRWRPRVSMAQETRGYEYPPGRPRDRLLLQRHIAPDISPAHGSGSIEAMDVGPRNEETAQSNELQWRNGPRNKTRHPLVRFLVSISASCGSTSKGNSRIPSTLVSRNL